VLDLGCGTGIPISKILMDEGMRVYGIDASPTIVRAFRENFPTTSVACESIEDSFFFNRTFDAIIAWGVFFLLSQTAQERLIPKVADALSKG
jgi:2-polyprenyl-3-methyl-5-hydroxy-6-metoxy-1,4-benzoquinol methylase